MNFTPPSYLLHHPLVYRWDSRSHLSQTQIRLHFHTFWMFLFYQKNHICQYFNSCKWIIFFIIRFESYFLFKYFCIFNFYFENFHTPCCRTNLSLANLKLSIQNATIAQKQTLATQLKKQMWVWRIPPSQH